jgi:hypothetical protein
VTAVVDLTGPIVTTVRDNAAVAAITTRVRGGELASGDTAPAVVIVSLGNTRSPFGPGRGRLGLQQPRLAANCYAATYQQAAQLAGAVSDALHLLSTRTISGKVIRLVIDDGWGGPVLDPGTGWVTETVIFEVTGHA